jgi:hypothetical protein
LISSTLPCRRDSIRSFDDPNTRFKTPPIIATSNYRETTIVKRIDTAAPVTYDALKPACQRIARVSSAGAHMPILQINGCKDQVGIKLSSDTCSAPILMHYAK